MGVLWRVGLLPLVGAFIIWPIHNTVAEQLRYIDDAGNIRFVDKVAEVPPKYRQQVVPPTPTIYLDKKGKVELERRQREAAREKERKEAEKKRELERQKRELERRQKREAQKLRQRDDSNSVRRLGKLDNYSGPS